MTLKSSIPLWIFGLDTGDVEMIRHWVRQGHLPAIGSLLGRGCWAVVSGPEMVAEYGAALTLFSGVSRPDHGYYYMRQLQPGTYNLVRVDPEDVQGAPPFWAHLAGANRRVLIIDVPDIALVPGLPGCQISNWGTHHSPRDPATEPPELLREVLEVAGPRIRADVDPDSTFEKDQQLLQTWRQRAKARGRLCRRLLQEGSFDLINITFSETDPATTQFWKYREDAKGQGRVPGTSLRHAIRETFEVIDRELASLLALLPSEANVIFYCLYGQEDNYPPCTLTEEFCRKLGYHVARPPAPGSFRLLDLARRFVPQSIRLRISRRLPAGMQENLLASQLLRGTDWSRTRAFAIPSLYTGFIRVNLRGREPQGIVSSGQEYRRLLDDLENDLRQLQDPVDGQPAVRRVHRSTALFGKEPPWRLPDLFVEWKPSAHLMERILHSRGELRQPRPSYCSESQESLQGLLIAAGPSIRRQGFQGEISVLDVAPTCLRLLGRPVPSSMKGRVLEEWLGE
jgi:predicted AlkP superfamily phosphohydrolase/phosphomutase